MITSPVDFLDAITVDNRYRPFCYCLGVRISQVVCLRQNFYCNRILRYFLQVGSFYLFIIILSVVDLFVWPML